MKRAPEEVYGIKNISGDRLLELYGSISGGAGYVPEIMSVYRYDVVGSASNKEKSSEWLSGRILAARNFYYLIASNGVPREFSGAVISAGGDEIFKRSLQILRRGEFLISLKGFLVAIYFKGLSFFR